MNDLRIGTIEEAPLEASKWLSVQALLDVEEMENLLNTLSEAVNGFYFFLCGSICKEGEAELSRQVFLEHYGHYISLLQQGKVPDSSAYRPWFYPVMTTSKEPLCAIPVGEGKQLVRVCRPVVQLQAHHMGYSPLDGKFRPMVFGSDSIPWGIQFSYPQLFRDHVTKQVEQTKHNASFPNTELFQVIQKWMRTHTVPTSFVIEGNKVNVPMRLGKACLSWINNHALLGSKGISVL